MEVKRYAVLGNRGKGRPEQSMKEIMLDKRDSVDNLVYKMRGYGVWRERWRCLTKYGEYAVEAIRAVGER